MARDVTSKEGSDCQVCFLLCSVGTRELSKGLTYIRHQISVLDRSFGQH